MPTPFSKAGRDYYNTPDGRLVSVDKGFDVASAYQGLVPATADDYDANEYEKLRAPVDVRPEFNRTEGTTVPAEQGGFFAPRDPGTRAEPGQLDPDAALGSSNVERSDEGLAGIKEFTELEPAPPEEPKAFSKDGRDYYVGGDGKLVSVDAGFDPSEDYPDLVPATAEQVHKNEIQKRSGKFIDQVETVGHTAAAATLEAGAGLYNVAHDAASLVAPTVVSRFTAPLTGKDIAPVLYGQKETEQREANPTAAFVGAAVPDLALNYVLPGAGAEASAAKLAATEGGLLRRAGSAIARSAGEAIAETVGAGPRTAAARMIASGMITEAGDAVIEGHEFDMGTALGVWAPMQGSLELAGHTAFKSVAKGLGWTRNAVNDAVQRARSSAVQDALRETDPEKQAAKLIKQGPAIYEQAQAGLDEALGTIDDRLGSAPDKLFTRSALKRSVSNNIGAQADAMTNLATQAAHAAEVTGSQPLEKLARTLADVRGSSGPTLYDALRQARRVLSDSAALNLDNPLVREVAEALDNTLGDENVWGRVAKDHTSALEEAARAAADGPSVRHSVQDVASREAIDARLERARRVASLTKDEKLGKAVEKAREALETADKVTGARLLASKATPEELKAMRETLDAFPDRAPKLAETVAKHLDTLDEVAPQVLPETWTIERVARNLTERVAGSKGARVELEKTLKDAEKRIANAKKTGSLTAGKAARATQQLDAIRAVVDDIDEVAKAAKLVRDFDAAPRNRVEKVIDTFTGKTASSLASRVTGTIGGAVAGFVGGGIPGAVVGGATGEVVNKFVEPIITEKAGKFGSWLKSSLRKYGKHGLGAAALVGANRLAYDENDASPQAAAAVGLLALPLFLSKAGKRVSLFGAVDEVRAATAGQKLKAFERFKVAKDIFGDHAAGDIVARATEALDEARIGLSSSKGLADKFTQLHAAEALEQRFPAIHEWLGDVEGSYDPSAKRHTDRDFKLAADKFATWGAQAGPKMKIDVFETLGRYAGNSDYHELNLVGRKGSAALKELEARAVRESLDEGESPLLAKKFGKARAREIGKAAKDLQKVLDHAVRDGQTLPGTTYRGILFSERDLQRVTDSPTVEAYGFMSTSVDRGYADKFVRDKRAAAEPGMIPVVVEVRQKTGVPMAVSVDSVLQGKGEREVLLRAGTRFAVDRNPEGLIRLTELDTPPVKPAALTKERDHSLPWVAGGLLALGGAEALTSDDDSSGAKGASIGLLLPVALLAERSPLFRNWAKQLMALPAKELEHRVWQIVPRIEESALAKAEKDELVGVLTKYSDDAAEARASAVDPFKRQLSDSEGATPGGFYEGSDGKVRYIKHLQGPLAESEIANAKMYEDFGVAAVIPEHVEGPERLVRNATKEESRAEGWGDLAEQDDAPFRVEKGPRGIATEKLSSEWRTIDRSAFGPMAPTEEAAREYVRGIPADIVSGNWDIAPNGGNIVTDGKRIMRLDAGEAGLKSLEVFNSQDEWERLEEAVKAGSFSRRVQNRSGTSPGTPRKPHHLIERVLMPENLSAIKADLQTGLSKIDSAIEKAGGVDAYAAMRFAHAPEDSQKRMASALATRLKFVRENIDKIAVVAALGANELFGDDDEQSGALAASAGGLALLLAGRPLFAGKAAATLAHAAEHIADPRLRAIRAVTDAKFATLTSGEAEAMRTYTQTSSFAKRALETERLHGARGLSDDDAHFLDEFKRAVKKLEVENPTATAPLVRGIDMSDDQIERLADAKELQIKSFSSATYFPDKASEFAVGVPYEWHRFGKPMSAHAVEKSSTPTRPVQLVFEHVDRATPKFPSREHIKHPAIDNESEVIIPPGGVFKATRIEEVPITGGPPADRVQLPGVRVYLSQVGEDSVPAFQKMSAEAERLKQGPEYRHAASVDGLTSVDEYVQYYAKLEPEYAEKAPERYAIRNQFRRLQQAGLITLAQDGDDLVARALPPVEEAVKPGRMLLSLGLGLGVGANQILAERQRRAEQADATHADIIVQKAQEKADAINEAREQQLDETRDKLAYLSHQGRTLMQTAARRLAGPANDNAKVERVPGVTASAGIARFLGSNSTVLEAFEEKRRALETLQRDPMALVDELSDSYAELQDTAPELHSQLVAQTFKVAQFIQSKLPPTVGASLARPEGSPVNELQARQFALYYSAATDPGSVVQDLANNRARKEQVDTLRQVWPDTYQELKMAVLERMSQKRPTVEQRIRLDLLFDFGQGFDRALSPGLVAVLNQQRQQQGPGGAGGAQKGGQVPSRRTQPSIGGTGALPQLAMGPASGPGTLA